MTQLSLDREKQASAVLWTIGKIFQGKKIKKPSRASSDDDSQEGF
jgi:hypothetical protein